MDAPVVSSHNSSAFVSLDISCFFFRYVPGCGRFEPGQGVHAQFGAEVQQTFVLFGALL